MLSRLSLVLETEQGQPLSFQNASLFHGVLMESIDTVYAECLHTQSLRPYSQYLRKDGDTTIWTINALSKESYEGIILPLLAESFQEFELKNKKIKVKVVSKTYSSDTIDNLIDKYYFGEGGRSIRIRFMTPTAFKSDGKYVFIPDAKLIYQSLMNKYDAVSSNSTLGDEEVLEQLMEHTQLIQYRLQSTLFHMEGIRIPAFLGEISIKIHGPQPLVNLANTLFRFGEYSGIGIKTAVGMGAVELVERVRE